jgi:hypothetical protein
VRRFGNWCTTHRKTVILAWIGALVAVEPPRAEPIPELA